MCSDPKAFLENAGVAFRMHTHAPRVSFEDHRNDEFFDPAAAVKSLVFCLPDARYVIVGLPARARADYRRIADALGVRRADLRAATPELLENDLGVQPGGVAPLPLNGVLVLIDAKVTDIGVVFC